MSAVLDAPGVAVNDCLTQTRARHIEGTKGTNALLDAQSLCGALELSAAEERKREAEGERLLALVANTARSVRATYVEVQAKRRAEEAAKRQSIPLSEALEQAARSRVRQDLEDGQLSSDAIIELDGGEQLCVDDLWRNPKAYDKKNCLDPLEPNYHDYSYVGRIHLDGVPNVHSKAHGGRNIYFRMPAWYEFKDFHDDPAAEPATEPTADPEKEHWNENASATADAIPGRFSVIPAVTFALAKRDAKAYLIKGLIQAGDLVLLYAGSGDGKSFFALDFATAIAAGAPLWCGLKVRLGKVVYIVAEGVAGMRPRLQATAKARGVALESLSLGVIPAAPDLLGRDVEEVLSAIEAAGGADLVIIDTAAQSMPGGDENSSIDMGRLLLACRQIRETTGAAVVLVHHAGKQQSAGARGWSGLRAAADVELNLIRNGDDRVATVTKLKDGDLEGRKFPFRLRTVQLGVDEELDPITSCVVEHLDNVPPDAPSLARLGQVETLVLDVVESLGDPGQVLAESTVIAATVPRLPPPASGRDRRAERVKRAIGTLVDRGAATQRDGGYTFIHRPDLLST